MENIWEESIKAVENGASFEVNLEKRCLKINKKYIIKNGEFEGDLGANTKSDLTEIIGSIEALYTLYKHSVPSERSDSKRRKYFTALKAEELADEELCCNEPREVAQLKLELFILICILDETFIWDEHLLGKWFWQSRFDKDLVILKQWICGGV